jgi:hypothetical protein
VRSWANVVFVWSIVGARRGHRDGRGGTLHERPEAVVRRVQRSHRRGGAGNERAQVGVRDEPAKRADAGGDGGGDVGQRAEQLRWRLRVAERRGQRREHAREARLGAAGVERQQVFELDLVGGVRDRDRGRAERPGGRVAPGQVDVEGAAEQRLPRQRRGCVPVQRAGRVRDGHHDRRVVLARVQLDLRDRALVDAVDADLVAGDQLLRIGEHRGDPAARATEHARADQAGEHAEREQEPDHHGDGAEQRPVDLAPGLHQFWPPSPAPGSVNVGYGVER